MSAGSAAAAGAAARRRRNYEEEEEVTPMNTDASGAFEYKIIRSVTNAFRSPALFQQMLQEEGQAGWELVEKLDDGRVRLRRSIECRTKDAHLTQDPYRTRIGIGEVQLVFIILGSVFGTLGFIALMVFVLIRG
jgi:hypothetical protein